MITVRHCTRDDFPYALEAAPKFFTEAPLAYQSMPLSAARLTKTFENMLAQRLFLVAESTATQHRVGWVGALAGPLFFTETCVAIEVFWWVDPLVRGRAGLRLFDALKTAARAANAKKLIALALHGNNAVELESFYLRQGAHEFERAYIMEL